LIEAKTAAEAWDYLQHYRNAVLVDVRTRAEWMYVGTADLSAVGGTPVMIEWAHLGGGLNADFLKHLKDAVPGDKTLLMMCRSGARSLAAGMAAKDAGYINVINISDGFEGDLDNNHRRNTKNGWRAAGLPWRQS